MEQNRRSFLRTLGAGTAALAAGWTHKSLLAEPLEARKLGRIGIQLYTVRKPASTDLAGVLEQLARIGYKEVEFAGTYNHTAAEARDMLNHNGLVAPSAHIPIDAIQSAPDKTFADAHTLGLTWITVPSLPRGSHVTADDWKKVAAQFNDAATKAKAAGFRFAFHNHNDIVKKTGDVLPVDILMAETDPNLVSYEMDLFWAVSGGADPITLLRRYPGRFKMFHVKDGVAPYTDQTQADVGKGSIHFKPIFADAKGIQHYFVESDSAADPMTFAANSYQYLKNLNF
jgi:sugar phosphate isomerase/epimerase